MDITQVEMFLSYFVSHDETHLSWLVTTKLIKIFIKYDKNLVSWILKSFFFIFYFIKMWYIFIWYLSHFPILWLCIKKSYNLIVDSCPNMPDSFFTTIIAVFPGNAWQKNALDCLYHHFPKCSKYIHYPRRTICSHFLFIPNNLSKPYP